MKRLLAAFVVLAAGVVVLAVSLGDSGEEEPAAEKVFGELSSSDMDRLRSLSPKVREVAVIWAELSGDFDDNDLDGARRNVDRLNERVDVVRREASELENGELRKAVEGYVAPMDDYADAAERFVSVAEEEAETGVPTDPKRVDEMVADMERAATRSRVAEDRFRERLLAVLSPEQRKEIADQLAERREELNDRAEGDPAAP